MIKFISLFTLLIFTQPVMAQEDADAVLAKQAKQEAQDVVTDTADAVVDTVEEAAEDVAEEVAEGQKEIKSLNDGDYEKRLVMARRMHEIWPIRQKIEGALDRVAENLEEKDRLKFKNAMRKSIKFDALEEASIDAMADIFTEKELDKMIEFYGSKEGRSVSFKTGDYEKALQPMIVKMMDKAVLNAKMGAQ